MGHEIDNTEGHYTFADSRNDAWHQLGQQVGHDMTPDEALEAAHMKNWNVRKVEHRQLVEGKDGNLVEVAAPDVFTVLRDNPINGQPEALGTVGNKWGPFQNEETTDLLYDITDQSGAHVQTIGGLRGGRETFVTMLMPTHVELRTPDGKAVDVTNIYLAVLNNHVGQGSLRALVSPIRIVCANTQRLAESMAISQVTLRHTGSPQMKLQEVRNLLGMTFKYTDVFAAEMEALAKAERDEEWVRAVLNDVFSVADAEASERARNSRIERVSSIMQLHRESPSVEPFFGTAYGAYNAVTEYADHFMPVLGKGDKVAKRALRTVTSPEVGALKARTATALKKALPLTADQVRRWSLPKEAIITV